MKNLVIVALLLCFMLPGCASQGQTGLAGGAAAGAVLGQAIGGNTKATLLGTAIGSVLGYVLGNELDKSGREFFGRAFETSPSNQTATWVNPDTQSTYAVTPQAAYLNQTTKQICRPAEVVVTTADGKTEKNMAIACRDNSGNWQVQN